MAFLLPAGDETTATILSKSKRKTCGAAVSLVIGLYCLLALDQYSIEKKRFTVGERRVRECGL